DNGKLSGDDRTAVKNFRSGLCLDTKGETLYTIDIDQGLLTAQRASDGGELKKLSVGGRPYDVIQARNGLLYVSDWAGRQVFAIDPRPLRTIARIPVGDHP